MSGEITRIARAWHRRTFLKGAGFSAIGVLVVGHEPRRTESIRANQPCSYGSGLYGSGLYSGALAAGAPLLIADRFGEDILLNWNDEAEAAGYEVWRSDRPFVPGDPGSTLIASIGTTDYTDSGAIGIPGDLYYVVRAILTCN